MGKNLHRTIIQFLEDRLRGHATVKSFETIDLDDFYAYKIKRIGKLSDMIVVLCDDYQISSYSIYSRPEILKKGGFFLIAKPEANEYFDSIPDEKLIIGKIGVLLGAISKNDFWNYTPPIKI